MDTQASTRARYSRIAMLLHWLIAISVIVNWRIAEAGEHAAKAEKEAIMANHFALGMVVLILTVLRIAWRLGNKPPPLAMHLKAWEVALARVTHSLFYILLIALPLLGWVAMSSYGQAIDMFGLFDWPVLPVAKDVDLAGTIFDVHGVLGSAMILLIGLHLLGVIKHLFIDRDGNLFRMLPFGKVKS
ncbi:MAG: cytochrome b [Sphingomonadaceae bacterium]|nr:cytochrome b [Sphingomonadaceae bacterium]